MQLYQRVNALKTPDDPYAMVLHKYCFGPTMENV